MYRASFGIGILGIWDLGTGRGEGEAAEAESWPIADVDVATAKREAIVV